MIVKNTLCVVFEKMIEEQGFYGAIPTSKLFMEEINPSLLASPDFVPLDLQAKQVCALNMFKVTETHLLV
jgi:hypothetical protein